MQYDAYLNSSHLFSGIKSLAPIRNRMQRTVLDADRPAPRPALREVRIANRPSSTIDRSSRRINAQGLGLLRQFERLPFYAEQSLREIEQAVLRQVTVPLTLNQFSALVSLTYSLGEANLKRSTLLRYLNAGCYRAAADEFDRWVYAGQRRLPELVTRRMAEKQLFLQPEK